MAEGAQTAAMRTKSVGVELFGHGLDWWNGWLVASLVVAALAAVAVVVTTSGVIIVQKREARASVERVAKLEKEAAEARLEVQKLRTPRSLDIAKVAALNELATKYRGTNVFFPLLPATPKLPPSWYSSAIS